MIVIFYLFASSRGAHHRRIRRLLLYGVDSLQLMSSRVRVRYGIMTHHQSRRHEGVRHLSDPARISSLSSASSSEGKDWDSEAVELETGEQGRGAMVGFGPRGGVEELFLRGVVGLWV